MAGWIGFLESSYANILNWLYNYGGACNGNVYGLIVTLYGNSSLWGMLLAPFCIRRWGRKPVLVVTNIFNIVFILMMLPFTNKIDNLTIWLVMGCLYMNGFMGAFAHILNPAIQADIRDYQQYRTGERIDGMFSAVATIGTVIALGTSSVLPIIYEKGGITKANATIVTSNPEVLNRMLGDEQTVGQILQAQMENGQDNYTNAFSALYDPNILTSLLHVLIIVSAVGALMNVIPYFWYDFNEKKQKSVVRVLKVRALFEDYGNGALKDDQLVEAIDLIRYARTTAALLPKEVSKKDYKSIKDKAERKLAKKAYREALEFNEEIEISQFVCEEMDKFSTDLVREQLSAYRQVYATGLHGLWNLSMEDIRAELAAAKAMPATNAHEKELRKFAIEIAKKKKSSRKAIDKYFKDDVSAFKKPEFAVLEGYFNDEDACDDHLKVLYAELHTAKKSGDREKAKSLKNEISAVQVKRKQARLNSKKEMDRHAYFNRAAKVYLDAEKLIKQEENYGRFEEIAAMYDDAKIRDEQAKAEAAAAAGRWKREEEALTAKLKAEKAAKKAAKKNK